MSGARVEVPRAALRTAPDDRLIALVREGDETAFEEIYARHHQAIERFCGHMLGSAHDGEDATQHTFLSAYRALARTDKHIRLRPWLYAIARNRCLDVIRGRRDRTGRDHDAADAVAATAVCDAAGPADAFARREEVDDLVADLHELPEHQRQALVLAEMGDLSHADIGEVLHRRPTQVKALVYQARTALQRRRQARSALGIGLGGGLAGLGLTTTKAATVVLVAVVGATAGFVAEREPALHSHPAPPSASRPARHGDGRAPATALPDGPVLGATVAPPLAGTREPTGEPLAGSAGEGQRRDHAAHQQGSSGAVLRGDARTDGGGHGRQAGHGADEQLQARDQAPVVQAHEDRLGHGLPAHGGDAADRALRGAADVVGVPHAVHHVEHVAHQATQLVASREAEAVRDGGAQGDVVRHAGQQAGQILGQHGRAEGGGRGVRFDHDRTATRRR
jgi:RNA polymerase sigma factor (sigma-70 family)